MSEPTTTQPQLSPSVKICKTCGEEKEIESFHRPKRKRRVCRDCLKKLAREYSQRPEAKEKMLSQERKAYMKAYYRKHAEKLKARSNQNSHKYKDARERYSARPDVRERHRIRMKTPQGREKARLYRARPETKARLAKWWASPKGKACMANCTSARRAKIKASPIPRGKIEELFKKARHCRYCGRAFSKTLRKTMDHVIPLAKDGLHSLDNLAVCCARCNSSKGDSDPIEWGRGMGFIII